MWNFENGREIKYFYNAGEYLKLMTFSKFSYFQFICKNTHIAHQNFGDTLLFQVIFDFKWSQTHFRTVQEKFGEAVLPRTVTQPSPRMFWDESDWKVWETEVSTGMTYKWYKLSK